MSIDNLEDTDEVENSRITTDPSLLRETSNPLDSVCAICMLTFRVDDFVAWSLRLSPCTHVYHTSCLRQWFRTTDGYTCPYCRGDFRGPMDGNMLTITDAYCQVVITNDDGENVHQAQIL